MTAIAYLYHFSALLEAAPGHSPGNPPGFPQPVPPGWPAWNTFKRLFQVLSFFFHLLLPFYLILERSFARLGHIKDNLLHSDRKVSAHFVIIVIKRLFIWSHIDYLKLIKNSIFHIKITFTNREKFWFWFFWTKPSLRFSQNLNSTRLKGFSPRSREVD